MSNDIHDLAAPYALNALTREERDEFERHLNRCGNCRQEVEALSFGASRIGIASAEEVPASLRERVLDDVAADAHARAPRQRRDRLPVRWLAPIAAAAAVLLVLVAIVPNGGDSVDDILAAPDRVDVPLAATAAYSGAPAVAQVTFSAERAAAVVTFDGLQAATAGRVYELWVIESGEARPAGLFTPDDSGRATILLETAVEPGAAIGVTLEPAGGSIQPTGDILFLSEV